MRAARRAFRAAVTLVAVLALAGCTAQGTARPSTSPAAQLVSPSPTAVVRVSRDQAIAAARAARPDRARDGVIAAELRAYADVVNARAPVRPPAPDARDLVWLVNLGDQIGPLNAQGTLVTVDAGDGHVIQAVDWIS